MLGRTDGFSLEIQKLKIDNIKKMGKSQTDSQLFIMEF